MAKIIYNGEYEKKAITDQFVENLGGMLEKDPDDLSGCGLDVCVRSRSVGSGR